jgi:hypothetical protein
VWVKWLAIFIQNGVSVAIDNIAIPRLAGDAVQHPAEHSAQESSVDQVDGETLLPEPEKETVGEEILGGGGDVDGKDDQVDTNGGVASTDVHVRWEDVVSDFEHVVDQVAHSGCSPG